MSEGIAGLAETALTAVAPEIVVPVRAFAWIRTHGLALALALGAVALLALLLVAVFFMNYFSGAKRSTAVAQVASATDSAMTTSGADAVGTVEAQDSADQITTRTVTYAQAAVVAAPDAAAADAAGRSGLCAIATDLCPAARVQQPVAH